LKLRTEPFAPNRAPDGPVEDPLWAPSHRSGNELISTGCR
jgi:hypothetical protein